MGIKKKIREFLQDVGLIPSRHNFLNIIPKNRVGAELGVFKGEFSRKLAVHTKPSTLYLVDPWWKLHGEYFPSWANAYNKNQPLSSKDAFNATRKSVEKWIHKGVVEIIVDKDLDFLTSINDQRLDWVYIDSTHQYDQTKSELKILDQVMNKNGLILGHDWRPDPNHIHHGVFKAVKEFCEEKNWEIIAIDEKFVQWAIKRK